MIKQSDYEYQLFFHEYRFLLLCAYLLMFNCSRSIMCLIWKYYLEVLMMKHCINYSIVYTVLAIIGGMLYREFTKMDDYTGWTTLSVVHAHYFILGMMFFLILGSVSMNMNLKINRAVLFYNVGLI